MSNAIHVRFDAALAWEIEGILVGSSAPCVLRLAAAFSAGRIVGVQSACNLRRRVSPLDRQAPDREVQGLREQFEARAISD